jgi:hypothetical protein
MVRVHTTEHNIMPMFPQLSAVEQNYGKNSVGWSVMGAYCLPQPLNGSDVVHIPTHSDPKLSGKRAA